MILIISDIGGIKAILNRFTVEMNECMSLHVYDMLQASVCMFVCLFLLHVTQKHHWHIFRAVARALQSFNNIIIQFDICMLRI